MTPPAVPQPEHALAEAARLITHTTQRLLGTIPQTGGLPPEQLREVGWQLVQLTARLADTAAALAVRLDEHGSNHLPPTEHDRDPVAELTHAARQLTELRLTLERAAAAARDYHADVGRLGTEN